MRGPEFDELMRRAEEYRAIYRLRRPHLAVYAWHDCIGHCLFHQFTPASVEGEMLAGRHQRLVVTGDKALVVREAPAKFDDALRQLNLTGDPDALAIRDALLGRIAAYVAGLELFDNLADYDEPFFEYLKRVVEGC
jgi:hypothetical protein